MVAPGVNQWVISQSIKRRQVVVGAIMRSSTTDCLKLSGMLERGMESFRFRSELFRQARVVIIVTWSNPLVWRFLPSFREAERSYR